MAPQSKPIVSKGNFVVGTVLPYAGRIDSSFLEQHGWLYCDGSEIRRQDYAELFQVIGTLHGSGDGVKTFKLPDYRGYFLRGVDDGADRDPDTAHRGEAAPGGATGDECGSEQGYATALPATDFTTAEAGKHKHSVEHIPTDNSSYAAAGNYQALWNSGGAETKSAGSHHHTLEGGDAETRPVNAYVYYLIKYRAE